MFKKYLTVDKDGTEYIWECTKKPIREGEFWNGDPDDTAEIISCISLPNGTIKKIIGKELTWNDEPYDFGI